LGKLMLTLISVPAVTGNIIGSLRTGAPDGMVTELRPSKVTLWIDSRLTCEASVGIATVAEPIKRGDEPHSFDKRSRI
jgi:hypothetical protein